MDALNISNRPGWSATQPAFLVWIPEFPVEYEIPDMLVADWRLLPDASNALLAALRKACPIVLVIVLINGVEVRRHAAISAGADGFISRGELPERVAEHLRIAAAQITP